jgi:hypothetical protein
MAPFDQCDRIMDEAGGGASPLGEPPAVQLRREGGGGEFGSLDNFAGGLPISCGS